MANSYIEYTANGSTTTFSIPFAYTNQADVTVFVGGTSTSFTFASSSTISLSTAPTSGVVVRIARTTPITTRAVDFSNGAILTEADLDNSNIQVFQAAQEAIDIAASSIFKTADGKFDAQSRVIKNVANPVNAQDAVTKNWAETASTSQVGIATTKASEASASATASANSATAASSSASGSGNSATAAANSATAGAASASTASTQAALATTNGAAQVALATTQAGLATTNGAAQVALATTQAGLATTNGAAQVVLATAQKTIAVTKASESAASATASANSATASANSATAAASSTSTANTKASEASTSASNAASSLASFTGQYVSQSGAPASPSTGDLWFDTSSSTMKVYNGSAFANAGSSVNGVENAVQHTATAGQTSFSATYDAGHLQVFLNGIRLDTADYTATNGNAVVLAIAAAVGDVVFIQGFGTFVLADVYTKSVSDGRFKAIGALEGGPSLGTNSILRYNANTINENISVSSGLNAFSAGPITIANNKTVTIANNATWSII